MDAPLYPPSVSWEPPVRLPEQMTTRISSIADFLTNPEAKAIMLSEVSSFEAMVSSPMLKPHLGNMSPRAMAQFGVFKNDALDRVDTKLASAHVFLGGGE